MPHFDQFGGDEWICHAPNHSGNPIQNSKVKSEWRPDITGHQSAGNTCPPCVRAFDSKAQQKTEAYARGYGASEKTIRRMRQEPLNRLDYADDPAEFEVQRELRRMGIENEPRPTECPCLNDDESVCGLDLESHSGFAGESILVCPKHSIVWEDSEGAIRNVI